MGVASSQSQQLKLSSSNIERRQGSLKTFTENSFNELEKTQSRILVSINSDNTVRISEGKSIATQTPREGCTSHIDDISVLATKEQNVKEVSKVEKKDEINQSSVQTIVISTENHDESEGIQKIDNRVKTPPLDFCEKETNSIVENPDLNQEKHDFCRGNDTVESNIVMDETDYSTDIGIQTDDDLEPRIAWGSKSVDSATTLHQHFKDEQKENYTCSESEMPTPAVPFEKLSLEKHGKYKVRLESDKEKCIISSASFLETGDAVVIDRSNQKLKFVDNKFQFISSYELPAKPWAVCSRGIDVYVTLGNTKIEHLIVEDMLIEHVEFFEIKGRCLGICVYDKHIAVGLQVGEICLLDFKGKKQETLQLPVLDGRTCNPWHLTATAEDNILVTDSDAGAVYCFNRKSELIFTFRDIGTPRGTGIDTDGNILVVGRDKETGSVITLLHKDKELKHMLHIEQQSEMKSRVLMKWEQLEFVPYCICYRSDRIVILGGIQEALKIMTFG